MSVGENMQDRLQIIFETVQQIVEREEPRPAAARGRRESRGKRRFTKPTPAAPKKSTISRAALLAAIEDGDKNTILNAIRRLKANLETEQD